MKLQRRVVVTGMGIVSPIGNSINDAWDACKSGVSGISFNETNIPGSPVTIGGRIKDLDYKEYLDVKEIRRLDPFIQYSLISSSQAIKDASIDSSINYSRVGVNFSSGIGGISNIEKNHNLLNKYSYKKISPFFVPGSIINMASGLISIRNGFTGPSMSTVTACSAASHSIGMSARSIAYGDADIMIAGGGEMSSTPLGIGGFIAARALSESSDPLTASRPWDKDRDGFVLSDGSASLVLEEYEHAVKRNVHIYGELIGFGMSSDAYHMTAPPENGRGAATAMQEALKDAEIDCSEINYINAHGTSTPLGDLAESNAIKSIFTNTTPNISSTKSMTGHTLGAAGAIESIFSLLAIRDGVVPPTINLDNLDPNCGLDFTPLIARERKITTVMNNSFGFGGTNSSLIFKRV
ncbi:beta-ketoacyl-ACP synthase II [Gammaproteobacteria bacterium]|nr:beta-ketoacyl-ACP synthase II [Gammaproteobacteria bacterium]MDA9997373.1 beta-ketoacyl-ACP synthase II [Gammaproteobacteria bacterium]MDC1124229.1 beta-ketoacyl-ACP synthase II [Gammaproteobacteria bacterium]MDC3302153.1 beta-ketoacyl-ACP synthase II [Gammaproteobacteria bacterium]